MEIRHLHFQPTHVLCLLGPFSLSESIVKKLFDQHYLNNSDSLPTESLLQFFEEIVKPRLQVIQYPLSILDLGSGPYSLFEDQKNSEANIVALDFSSVAISKAPQSTIKYLEGDITNSTLFSSMSFDLIFDSHCMNCITEESHRLKTYKNIYQFLKSDGYFAAELMVQPIGEMIAMPYKKIKSALEIENEILAVGFKIVYFMIVKGAVFENNFEGEIVRSDVVRVIARK